MKLSKYKGYGIIEVDDEFRVHNIETGDAMAAINNYLNL